MTTRKALQALSRLPRISHENIDKGPIKVKQFKRKKLVEMPKYRQRYVPIGFEEEKCPFFLKYPVQKWAKERYDISYVPLTLRQLQLMVDTDRLNVDVPIDLTQIYNTGLLRIDTRLEHGGIMLDEEGLDSFCAPLNLEVQFASEACIAAVEKAGGTITTAYYDPYSLSAVLKPLDFFKKGQVIPRRQLPPQRLIEYYSDARNRGYLSNPQEVAEQRLILSQKFGYTLPDISQSPKKDLLLERKDPRQVFFGLEPGWLVNLVDKVILKPSDPDLIKFYSS